MQALAVPLAVLATAVGGPPPDILYASVRVDRPGRSLVVRTVVAAPARRALQPRYRTTLLYQCGADAWRTARREPPSEASDTIVWRYPRRLSGRRCGLMLRVAAPEGSSSMRLGRVVF